MDLVLVVVVIMYVKYMDKLQEVIYEEKLNKFVILEDCVCVFKGQYQYVEEIVFSVEL